MKIKTIIATVSAVLVVGAMLTIASCASHQPKTEPCAWLKVEITDSLEHRFVETTELRDLIYRSGLSPAGKAMDDIDCHDIEECVLNHEMIRNAVCFKSPRGGVYLRVTQRVPILRVVTTTGSYYVDNNRTIMPNRSSIRVEVPTFKGDIGERAAVEEYADFALWLTNHSYWQPRIKHIQVYNPKHLVLAQNDDMGNIILGELTNYESKLNKLHKLYTKGFDKIGYKSYREYDLRYDNQVVGRE